jgi:hypothetical protein
MQFRYGSETGTATAAAMAKLAVHAEECQDRHAAIHANRLSTRDVARITINTLLTCRPRTRTRARPQSRPEKSLLQQLQQLPAIARHSRFTKCSSRAHGHLGTVRNAHLNWSGRKRGAGSDTQLDMELGSSRWELEQRFQCRIHLAA